MHAYRRIADDNTPAQPVPTGDDDGNRLLATAGVKSILDLEGN